LKAKKIISNPLANLRPQKMQYGAKVGFGKVNRQEVFTTTVKGSDAKGMYTDTNKTRRMISTQDLLQNARPMPGLMV
jgi:hypothetical protein